jgi:XTP/dITP diphosphohydrolase
VLKKLGTNGILKLMENAKDRSAYFDACLAYHDGAGIRTFLGKCDGSISQSACGKAGFGFDPIFIPLGHSQTFAESIELKNSLSHRYKSLLEFSKNIKLR